jgi:hypothetical protein
MLLGARSNTACIARLEILDTDIRTQKSEIHFGGE